MNPVLQEAIIGSPVMVKLGARGQEKEYPLAFPVQAVILYKNETARLDRQRAEERRQRGVAKLTAAEIRDLRQRRQAVLKEAEALRPAKGHNWVGENYAQFDSLMDEATLLKIAIDEDAGTGDSLYDLYNWRKISPDGDPERMLLALWIGLHEFVQEGASDRQTYRPRLSREEIGRYIHAGNATELTLAISQTLSAHLIAPPEIPPEIEEEAVDLPNVRTPEVVIPAEIREPEIPASRTPPWKQRQS
jgi:hypothetical protein